ncbi:MAG: NAD(P)H-binding protein [Bacteroidota bacterium]
MKITLTGSLGHIGKPLAVKLVEQGHEVKVISSNVDRGKEISALGATPAIGKLQDTDFLIDHFKESDLVYTLVPPDNYFDHSLDLFGYFKELGNSFADAIRKSGVSKVVNLSSIGAHLETGNGILEGTYQVEKSLDDLPENVSVTHIRPVEIYYNLYQYIDLIKGHGIMASNLKPDTVNAWVAIPDIVDCIVDEMNGNIVGRNVRYVVSEEVTYQELASAIGGAIGLPDLQWVQITDAQMQENLTQVGMQPKIAEKMTEMYTAIRSGLLYEHYWQNKPQTFGVVKLKDFAKDFAVAYHNKGQ